MDSPLRFSLNAGRFKITRASKTLPPDSSQRPSQNLRPQNIVVMARGGTFTTRGPQFSDGLNPNTNPKPSLG